MCSKYRGLKCLLLRRTLPELRENHVLPLRAMLDGYATYNQDEKCFYFPNNSRLKLGYCDTDADVLQYQGQEYDVIFFEEATQFTEYQIRNILLCNRGVRPDFKPRAYFTCNPGGPSHQYIKRLFIDRDYREGENPDDYTFIQAKVTDNKALMEADPGYYNQLLSLPEDERRAFLDGDWDVFAGQFFKEFRRSIHVVEPNTVELQPYWRRFCSIDYGFNDHTAVLWYAIAPDQRIYVYRELYVRHTLASEIAKSIRKLSEGENISYTVASPDMWNRHGNDAVHGESTADTFAKYGVRCQKADNSRIVGWHRVREYLAVAPDELPYLQIFSTCANLIRTLPMLCYDERKPDDAADGPEQDMPDSLRYGLMSRPRPGGEPQAQLTGTWHYQELKLAGYTDAQIRNLRGVKIIGGKKNGKR